MTQSDTVAFLSSGRAFPDGGPVEVIETHGAYLFLSGDTALKLKRAVKYDYMDLSTVDLRKTLIARELELNQPAAPQIYRDVLPVTRDKSGLSLGGDGPVVDWVLRMWRFSKDNEMERIAERGALDDRLATVLGEVIAQYHAKAPVLLHPGAVLMSDILDELSRVFEEFQDAAGTEGVQDWLRFAATELRTVADLLDRRGREGHVRRAHGDLHLRNLVLIEGLPVPFDALEFDETLGTCDVLYDIAFLIMDLCHRKLDRQACRVLDAWLRTGRGNEDTGLAALPLFLSVRAAIRAMVLLQTDAARRLPGQSADEIAAYLNLAEKALAPAPPKLIAVGGFSGSGKSVLARDLAPGIGALPGAVLLSSDLERRVGLSNQRKLDIQSYKRDRREAVYHMMFGRAAGLLAAGHTVLLDATFLDQNLRTMAEQVALQSKVPFQGFWLDVPESILKSRLMSRKGDASDADISVLEKQLIAERGDMSWHKLDASGDAHTVRATARKMCRA